MKHKNFLVVISGPTAVGKTAAAIQVAKEFHTQIISADSRQFFKELNVGTAKPSAEELKQVKHHFINSHSIEQEYNVGLFEQDAKKVLKKIFEHTQVAVMAGGSGLYLDAVCKGFDKLPPSDEQVRKELTQFHKDKGIAALRAMLQKLDAAHYKKVDLQNPHRIIRSLEVCIITGKPYSSFLKQHLTPSGGERQEAEFSVIKIGLEMEREKLYERVNQRVDKMLKDGLLAETQALLTYKDKNALQTVGYKELFEHLEGKTDLRTAVEKIKQNTRNFAKRQLTWFRRDKKIQWFNPSDVSGIIEYIKLAMK